MPSLSTNQRSVILPFIDKQGNLDKKKCVLSYVVARKNHMKIDFFEI